jgi:hypothetical protein
MQAFYDADIDRHALDGKTIAIIGYGERTPSICAIRATTSSSACARLRPCARLRGATA